MNMNKTAGYKFTIIVPVYNEEDNIYALEERLRAYLPAVNTAGAPACVLFVNDGSKDASPERLREICGRNEHFYYLDLAQNSGLSAAMKAGIDASFSEYVGYMDADLQTAPEDFDLLLPHMGEYEMVMGTGQDVRIRLSRICRRRSPTDSGG